MVEAMAAEPEVAAGAAEGTDPSVSQRFLALFAELQITKFVLVDDRLEVPLDAALITRIVSDNAGARDAAGGYFPGIDLTDANENLFEQIDALLGTFDANRRDELTALLASFDEGAADVSVARMLRELLPPDFPAEFLTPLAWATSRDGLLAECTATTRTLFLFDQQLGEHGEGTAIIAEMARQDRDAFGARWFCGLLSHTLQKGDEVSSWRKLSEEKQLELELFMPISKQNLSDGDAFYGAVYRTVINIYAERMKDLALAAFKQAFNDTLVKFTNLDPVDFEHIVAKSSEAEGVSELDTLFRLYSIIERDQVKQELLRPDRLTQFLGAARTVKDVADVGRALSEDAEKRLAKLRAKELYEDRELINGFRDPLRNGDLFEVGSGNSIRLWVLIAQPCDLMVRANGKRAFENNFKVAVLAPVKQGRLGNQPTTKPGHGFALERFDHDRMQAASVTFSSATPVDLSVLDLAVLRDDGTCDIDTNTDGAASAFSSVAWDQRAKRLHSRFKSIATKIEDKRAATGEEQANEYATFLLPSVGPDGTLRKHGRYDHGRFIYAIKRAGRVREPIATALLTAFSRYLSRDAYEHDFSVSREG
jgi:hypothetical protein